MIHLKYLLMGIIKFVGVFLIMIALFHLVNLLGFYTVAIPIFLGLAYFIGWLHYYEFK